MSASIARLLVEHMEYGLQFGPDRLMSVTCACGVVTAADDYEAAHTRVAAVEVHARHQAEVLKTAIPTFTRRHRVIPAESDFEQMVNVVLDHSRTPRTRLFEYPYRGDESRKLIKDAEEAVKKILRLSVPEEVKP